ncbi:MAG TPA: hypothetical protein VMT46_17640 [Anaerolineaceae bacterium]|nr:hypothetical protein [Anaerolineaceae bacterium]
MGKGKLLLIETDPDLADQVEAILNAVGYEVASIVSSAQEALRSIGEIRPDLVLIDEWFEGGTRAALTQDPRLAVPILNIVDYIEIPTTLGRSHTAQLCGYIPKTFHCTDLCRAVERSLVRRPVRRGRVQSYRVAA